MNAKNYVIGIGASVGGLDAIKQLFDHLSSDIGMSFVIIQYLSPDYKSSTPELLARHTGMRIFPAKHNQPVEPNCIYLIQSDKNFIIKDHTLIQNEVRSNHLPIDMFFQSLSEEFSEKAIGVILSGTGSDGLQGIRAIKNVGGTIIVQDPGSAQFDGMPNAAISTNLVDFIFEPQKIANYLNKITNKHLNLSEEDDMEAGTNDAIFIKILHEIHKATGIDFKDYKRNTLIRRLEKRLNHCGIENLAEYYNFILNTPAEKEFLKQEFLIGVTSFFRDPEAFIVLREKVIPVVCQDKTEKELIRIWIPGCSTGEEVFTVAMLFDEYIAQQKVDIDFKVFATDVDPKAIAKASTGIYPVSIFNNLDRTLSEKYFIDLGDKLEITRQLREKVVFSIHNILKDPPFIRMDLITCRNLLIYLDSKSQKKVLSNFRFALNKYGFLFLGNSESLGDIRKHFEQIDLKWKIFRNLSEGKPIAANQSHYNKITNITYQNPVKKSEASEAKAKENPESVFHRFLSDRYSPSCLFIDKNFNILFIKGNAGKRLIHSEGLFEKNLLKVVNPEIATVIRAGIHKVEVEKKEIVYKGVTYSNGEDQFVFDICIYRSEIAGLQETYVIEFGEDRKVTESERIVLNSIQIDDYSKQQIAFLEDELKSVKTELQNVIEELETSNEELQSANEELMSSNEELQGTNEEMQSANEELYTVNAEIQEKNKELADLNNDINNLLNSTDIGTLFLDNELRIRKFTPALQRHFKLQETDLGRPIESFASNFSENTRLSIITESQKALRELVSIEKEIVDNDNRFYLKRISPFITTDKKIDGVVVTFVDISELKKTKKRLSVTEAKYKNLFDNLNEGFFHARVIADENGNPIDWEYIDVNPAFANYTNLRADDIIGHKASELFPEAIGERADIFKIYMHTAITGEDQYLLDYRGLRDKYFVLHVFCPQSGEFAATFSEITKLKEAQKALSEANERLELANSISEVAIWEMDYASNQIISANEVWERLYGLGWNNVSEAWSKAMHPDDRESAWSAVNDHIEGKTGKYVHEFRYRNPTTGKEYWISNTGKIVTYNPDGTPARILGVSADITERKLNEERIKESEQKFRKIFENSPFGMVMSDRTFRFIAVNDTFCQMLGYDKEELSKLTFKDITHPAEINRDAENARRLVAGEILVYKTEKRYLRKDGQAIWASLTANANFGDDGSFKYVLATIENITFRKQAELEIRSIKERLDLATSSSNIGIWDWDIPLNHLVWDRQMYKLYGVDESDFSEAYEAWLSRIHPDDKEMSNEICQLAVLGLSGYDSEFRVVWPDGSVHWLRAYGKVFYSDDHIPLRMVGVNFDITSQKEAEILIKENSERIEAQNYEYLQLNEELVQMNEELQAARDIAEKNEFKYRKLFTSLQEGVFLHEIVYDESGKAINYRIIDGNPVSEQYLNIKLNDAKGKLATELYGTPEAPFLEFYSKVAESGEPFTFDQYFEPMKKHFFISVFSTQKGQFATVFFDITENKNYEKELLKAKENAEESENKYKLLVENIQDVIWVLNLTLGKYTFISQSVFQLRGFTVEEALQQDMYQSLTELSAQKLMDEVPKRLDDFMSHPESEKFYIDELQQPCKDGSIIWIETATHFQYNSKGEIEVVGISRNIEDRKKAERELLLAKEKAEESDRFKTAFLQNISHEVRTPLNAIMGFSELIKNNFHNKEKLEKFSTIISRRSNDLLDIINDIIDISKIESGQLPVNIDVCDLHTLFAELGSIISDYQINAGKQHLTIEPDIQTNHSPRMIIIDRGKLKQIFVNLLTNAVKYTAHGNIRFGVTYGDEGLVFFVTDTGDGIPADKHDVVFNRFVRLQNARTSNIGGTGLGLSITKGIVNLLGGRIWVESEPGKGSKFSFTVDYTTSEVTDLQTQKKKSETSVTALNINVMIVEDDQWNAEYLQEVLSAITQRLIVVATGKDAIEAVQKDAIDVILMDVRLPDMTGYEVVEEIRKIKPEVKTIIQTAYASNDERAKALEAGCIDYLSKPVKNDQLIEMLFLHFN